MNEVRARVRVRVRVRVKNSATIFENNASHKGPNYKIKSKTLSKKKKRLKIPTTKKISLPARTGVYTSVYIYVY